MTTTICRCSVRYCFLLFFATKGTRVYILFAGKADERGGNADRYVMTSAFAAKVASAGGNEPGISNSTVSECC